MLEVPPRDLMHQPADPQPFLDRVFEAFERSGLVLVPFGSLLLVTYR